MTSVVYQIDQPQIGVSLPADQFINGLVLIDMGVPYENVDWDPSLGR